MVSTRRLAVVAAVVVATAMAAAAAVTAPAPTTAYAASGQTGRLPPSMLPPPEPPPSAEPPATPTAPDTPPPTVTPPGTARCAGVAHVGDSTTVEAYDQQVAAYALFFADVLVDAGGGRAVLQTISSDPHDGLGAVAWIRDRGYAGCWVVALGTNDAANIAAGANYTAARVIDRMLGAIDPTATTPVAWVEVFTTKTSGYWNRTNMEAWNRALREATTRWPNLVVLPWAGVAAAHPEWLSDGIHHTRTGREQRTSWIAATAYAMLNA